MSEGVRLAKTQYRVKKTGLYTRLMFAAMLSLTCGLVVATSWSSYRQFEQVERTDVLQQLALIRAKIEGNIAANVQTALGLAAAIAADPALTQGQFTRIASPLFRGHTQLRNVGAAPDMVLRFIYPLEGNESAIGLNYRHAADQWAAASEARMTGELIVAGPVELKQGGQGLIGRLPVFVYDETGESGKFWGLVSAVIDLQRFYEDSGLFSDDLTINIAIRGRDATGHNGELFYGDESIFKANPVIANVSLPSGSWHMAAVPKKGWTSYWLSVWPLFLIGVILIGILLGLGVFILRLTLRRGEQEVRLQGLFDLSPLGIALNDFTTGEFLDVNGALITPTGYTREEFFSLNYWDLTPAAYEQEELEQLRLLSNHGRYGPYEKEYIRKDGSQYSVLLNGVLIENRAGRQLIWSMVEDISERKKSQRDLEESRSELQNFFDHSVNFMVILDRDGVFEKTNASFTYALGLVSSQVVGKSMFDFIHPEDVEASRLECQKILSGEASVGFNNRFKSKAGSYRNLKWHAAADMSTGKIYATGIDVTSQITDEEKILRQQEMLESMSQQANIGAWEVNLESNKLYWSDMTKSIHGLSLSYNPTLVSALEYYKPGKSRAIMEDAIQLCMERGVDFNEEVQIVTANDRELWVLVTGKSELVNGRCVRIYGSFQNINARKIAEKKIENTRKELEQQMALLEVIADSQASFIEQSDIKKSFDSLLNNILQLTSSEYGFIGEIIYLESGDPYLKTWAITEISWNAESKSLYRKSENEGMEFFNMQSLFGAAITSLNPIISNTPTSDSRRAGIPKGHPELNSFLGMPIRRGKEGIAMVGIANRAGGYYEEMVDWLHPLLNSIGQFVEGVRGIHARNQAEEQLVSAKNAAEEAAHAKSEFLAIMSHEIRTPLNGIMGMLNLLSRSGMSSEQKRKLDIASHGSETLLTIINDILDFSKVDAGKIALECLNFNIATQLDEFAESMAMRAQEKGLELIIDQTAIEYPMVNGDPGRIRQVMTNLVGNAIKFTSHGEIVVRASLTPTGDDLELRVSISDSGIGIPPEKISALFDPFTQVDASTTRTYGGTGLGLAISKKLCELMGGNIAVTSELGRGSNFEFYLHLERSNVEDRQPNLDLRNKRILVVDDNATNCEVMRNLLDIWGADVDTADNGDHALSACMTHVEAPYDVIVIDQIMPAMQGAELAEQIKKIEPLAAIPLVVMSRMSEVSLGALAQAGFSGHISKPVTGSQLRDCLSIVLEGGSTLSTVYSADRSRVGVSHLTNETVLSEALHRVLLVEDNPVNQDVAKMMLDDAGVVIDVAGNGIEALDALLAATEEDQYSIVLMDCQMPEMDGYEATRQIRQGSAGDGYRDIPIVAMTANAMKGDREKCFAAGMNDYISKPIDPELLEKKVQQWLEDAAAISTLSARQADAAAEKIAAPTFSRPQTNDVDGNEDDVEWDIYALLSSLKGRDDRVKLLLKSFNGRMDTVIAQFDLSVDNKDTDAIGFIAHSIKGSAGQLMARPLQQVAKELEEAARLEQHENVLALCPTFRGMTVSLYEKSLAYVKD
ncbi:response regulator [Teredinibacter purpureus]|uniref:response regulator n=1 Tax=Teredinibacter purpureus TaxID=2731756 RepID=UPI0009E2C980|nr:response regulator [Teredinibacter purpureus]